MGFRGGTQRVFDGGTSDEILCSNTAFSITYSFTSIKLRFSEQEHAINLLSLGSLGLSWGSLGALSGSLGAPLGSLGLSQALLGLSWAPRAPKTAPREPKKAEESGSRKTFKNKGFSWFLDP